MSGAIRSQNRLCLAADPTSAAAGMGPGTTIRDQSQIMQGLQARAVAM